MRFEYGCSRSYRAAIRRGGERTVPPRFDPRLQPHRLRHRHHRARWSRSPPSPRLSRPLRLAAGMGHHPSCPPLAHLRRLASRLDRRLPLGTGGGVGKSLSTLLSATALRGLTHTKIELVIDGDVPFPRLYDSKSVAGLRWLLGQLPEGLGATVRAVWNRVRDDSAVRDSDIARAAPMTLSVATRQGGFTARDPRPALRTAPSSVSVRAPAHAPPGCALLGRTAAFLRSADSPSDARIPHHPAPSPYGSTE